MLNTTQYGFPIHNDELESTPEVLVDCSLLQAAINRLKKHEPDDEVTLNLEAILANRHRSPVQVVLELRSLCVSRVAANTNVEVIVLDDDVDGVFEEECVERLNLDGQLEEFYSSTVRTAEVLPEQVTKIFEAVQAEGEK